MATKNKYAEYDKILYGTDKKTKAEKSINNYKARLEAAGVKDVDAVTDKRNIVEKALNLKQDQNILFDLFELLNRPQQALFNAWEASQKGNDSLDAAWKGLSGQKEVKFKDILKNYGMEDVEGKIDASDVLGFAGDVLLDPMDIVPIAGFSKFGDALDAGESFSRAAKNLKSGSDLVMSGIGKGIKGTAKLADKGIEKALAKADEVAGVVDKTTGNVIKFKYADPSVNRAADLVKIALGTGEDVSTKVVGNLENYKQIKNDISRMFTISKNHLSALLTQRMENVLQDDARIKNTIATNQAKEAIEGYAKAHNMTFDDAARKFTLFHEASMPREILNADLWELAKQGVLEANDDVLDALNRIIRTDIPEDILATKGDRIFARINKETNKIELGEDILKGKYDIKPLSKEKVMDIFDKFKDALNRKDINSVSELSNMLKNNITVINPTYSEKSFAEIEEVANLYANDKSFRNLTDYLIGTAWKDEPFNFTSNIFNDIPNYLNDKNKLMANNLLEYTSPNDRLKEILREARNTGSKELKEGLIERLNRNIDETMGSNLANKYDLFTNAGYVPHTLTEEGNKFIDTFNEFIGNKGMRGNASTLATRRRFGSIDEINDDILKTLNEFDNQELPAQLLEFKKGNYKLMEDNYIKAISNRYLDEKGITKVVKDANMANKVLLGETFGNIDEIKKLQFDLENARTIGDTVEIQKLSKQLSDLEETSGLKLLSKADSRIPKGYSQVDKSKFLTKLKTYDIMNKQIGLDSGMGDLVKSLEKYKGQIAIDDDILDIFNFASKRDNYTGLAGLYGKYMDMFKKWKTASPIFLLNNLLGNSSNLMLGGVSYADQAKYGSTVLDILKNGENYYIAKLSGQKLDANAEKIATLWQTYRSMGFDQSALALQELPQEFKDLFKQGKKLKGRELRNAIPYVNNLANIQMDNAARITIMLKAMDDPGFIKRLGVDNVRDGIAKIMFDPEMLTSFERNKIKKVIPFYTYAKNNLLYHITNMGQNGKKYNQLMKSMKGLQNLATDGNSENMSDFLKEGLYIPIPGVDKDGNYTVLRATLPFGQLLEFANSPRDELVSMLTPAIKNPLEMAMNKDTFTGRDIESFPGEMSKNIPFLTKKYEKMLSDFSGLDVPIKNATRVYQGIADSVANDQSLLEGIGQGLKNTVTMSNNVNTDELYRKYEEIDELQNIIKQFQQKGTNVATINELKRANKNKTIEGIDAIFNKYGI